MTPNLYRKEIVLHRSTRNPLLLPKTFRQEKYVDAVFNCGQTTYQGKTLLLVPVVPGSGLPSMYVATSANGVDFEIEDQPFITAWSDHPEIGRFDIWPIDPRITRIGDTYYIVRPVEPECGTAAILEATTDWKHREYLGCIALPSNRVPCLFPEKIHGEYCRLDRPNGGAHGEIWVSYSPDLLHWGEFRQVLGFHVNNVWAKEKIGPTVPVRTSAGWLELFHGVLTYAGGGRYSLGAMLLDLDDPSRVIGLAPTWILTPDAEYEYMGDSQNTVFATGCIVDEAQDQIRVYYGAADTSICLASGKLSELLALCREGA